MYLLTTYLPVLLAALHAPADDLDGVPARRLGTMEELAAFTTVLLDGRSRFQTGQFFSFSGGWST